MPRPKANPLGIEGASEEDSLPALLPLEILPKQDIPFWDAIGQAKECEARDELGLMRAWLAYAYTRPDGFYHFCVDIVGLNDLHEPFHSQVCNFASGYFPNDQSNLHLYRLILAFRGSFKSSVTSVCLPAWKIAKEVIDSRGECNISIGVASERIALARKFVRQSRKVLESKAYRTLFGNHKPQGRATNWGTDEYESRFRNSLVNKDPTVFTIALGVERTGFHANIIIADDLQAYSTAFSLEQIEKCYELYTLLHSILVDSPTRGQRGEMVLSGTRWHHEDIYHRIKEAAKEEADTAVRFRTLWLPIVDKDGTPTFPTVFNETKIANIQAKVTSYVWACQYLLDPTPSGAKKFNINDLQYRNPQIDNEVQQRARFYTYMGIDPNFISADRMRAGEAKANAWTVVVTGLIDEDFNIYILECWRARPTKLLLAEEVWRQAKLHRPQLVGVQQFDYRVLKEEFDRMTHQTGWTPNFEWMHSAQGDARKSDRIEGALEGLVKAKKLWIYRGLTWLEEEFDRFPYSKTFDGLDAITNMVKVARAPLKRDIIPEANVRRTEADRHIDRLMRGPRRPRSWKSAY